MASNSSLNTAEVSQGKDPWLPPGFVWGWMITWSLITLVVLVLGHLMNSYLKKKPPGKQTFMDLAHIFLISSFQATCVSWIIGRIILNIWPDPLMATCLGFIAYISVLINITGISFNSITHLLFVLEPRSMLGMVANETYVIKIITHSIIWPWVVIACILWLAGQKPLFHYAVTGDPFPKVFILPAIIFFFVHFQFHCRLNMYNYHLEEGQA